MRFSLHRWYKITDSFGQNLFVFVDKIISEYEIVFDCEIYNFKGLYLRDCTVKYWNQMKASIVGLYLKKNTIIQH